jgi:gluconolactonase
VWVLDPSGERIGRITTPEICGSVVFGGPDLTTLFLTTTTTVHMMPTRVRSAPLPGPT